jgi:hypothetical protein
VILPECHSGIDTTVRRAVGGGLGTDRRDPVGFWDVLSIAQRRDSFNLILGESASPAGHVLVHGCAGRARRHEIEARREEAMEWLGFVLFLIGVVLVLQKMNKQSRQMPEHRKHDFVNSIL